MVTAADRSLRTHVATVADPRVERTTRPPRANGLTVAVAVGAVIGGAERWDVRAAVGAAPAAWFGGFRDLTHGSAAHDRGAATAAMHRLGAWAAATRATRRVLAQAQGDDQSTALTAIPAVLRAPSTLAPGHSARAASGADGPLRASRNPRS